MKASLMQNISFLVIRMNMMVIKKSVTVKKNQDSHRKKNYVKYVLIKYCKLTVELFYFLHACMMTDHNPES